MDRLEHIKQRIRVMEPRGGLPGGWEDDLYWLVKQVIAHEQEIERLRAENTTLKDALDWVWSVCEGTPSRPLRTIIKRIGPLLGRDVP